MGTLTNEAFHHDPEEVAAIFFTSGSTGSSKAVVYTSSMLHAQIQYMKDHFGYRPGGIDLCTFPLIGLLVISHGISIVLADMNMTRPVTMDPAKVTRNIRQYQCNSMFCSPMVMKKLGEYGIQHKITLPSLKKIYTAGAPVKPAVLNQFGQLLEPHATIHTPFGSTEALSVSDITDNELLSMYDPAGNYFHGICVGVPLKGIRLKVIQSVLDPIDKWDDKKLLSPDEVGEICVSGPNVSPLYLNNDNANKSTKIQDPANHIFWHITGDLGRINEAGRIWYYGRKSQCVISGDQIFYTIPTEAVFNQHPGVLRSALVGVVKENNVVPAICIELKRRIRRTRALEKELLDLGQKNEITQEISILLFFRKFPVDPRHNAKIRREILAQKAQSSIG